MGQGGDGRQVGVLGGLLGAFDGLLGFQLLRGVAKTCLSRWNACRFPRLLGELKHVQPCASSYRLILLRARLNLLLRLCFRPEHSLEPHYDRMADLRLGGSAAFIQALWSGRPCQKYPNRFADCGNYMPVSRLGGLLADESQITGNKAPEPFWGFSSLIRQAFILGGCVGAEHKL